MNVLDLFSGIGGFSLGLERAGMRTVAFCEIDPYCRAVLRKHWSSVPVYEDVRDVSGSQLWADGNTISIQVVCGGFPCQDISFAGKGAGLSGERSGLWWEMHRIIRDFRPQYAIIENVSALRSRGLDQVLRSLAEIGYDAEWHCIPASALGAPHRRDRIWIVAHSARLQSGRQEQWPIGERAGVGGQSISLADADEHPRLARRLSFAIEGERRRNFGGGGIGEDVADTIGAGLEGRAGDATNDAQQQSAVERSGALSHANSEPAGRFAKLWQERGHWFAEPNVGRVAHGIPSRVDRLRALGNAVVPQIPEIIGRAIMQAEGLTS